MLRNIDQIRKSRKSGESGFTIIEVMIVLAIAGLILLIVLLAIPALQRNSRNTQIKNDAANIIGGISTFTSDNDGRVPNNMRVSNGTVTLWRGTATTPAVGDPTTDIKIQSGTVLNSAVTSTPTTPPDPGSLTPMYSRTCDAPTVTNNRSVAIYYSIETTSGAKIQCVSS